MDLAKGFSDEKTKNDRISELPTNVMDNIFDRISIRDAARTSILSTKWRYVWASYPKLVFDENFFNEINKKHKNFIRYEFPKAINNVVLVHSGPVLEFVLHIPNIPNDLSPGIDQWMLFLSRNGIKKLELENSNSAPYIIPCCIFSCTSLVDLNVNSCILRPPGTFGGFHYLVNLVLDHVVFSANMSAALLLNSPVLESLTIRYCTGIEHRSIHAPILDRFCMVGCDNVDWKWFESNEQLTIVQIELGIEVKNEQNITMIEFLKNIPKLKMLWLDGFSLKYLAGENPSQSLAAPRLPCAPAPFLTSARLNNFRVDDLDQVSSVICLLKSCPNLMALEIIVATSTDSVPEPIKGYLEPPNMDFNLGMLQTVKFSRIKGLKAELLFIKLLLARSTCLRRMIIEQNIMVGASDGFKMSRDLLQFTRASSRAEIIHLVPTGFPYFMHRVIPRRSLRASTVGVS